MSADAARAACQWVSAGRRGAPSVCGRAGAWECRRAAWTGDATRAVVCSAHKGAIERAWKAGRVTPSILLLGAVGDFRKLTETLS